MRTTIKMRDDLVSRAKKAAIEHDSTLNEIVEIAVAEFLERIDQPQAISPVRLPKSKRTGGTRPGVDLDDTASLLDLIEGRS